MFRYKNFLIAIALLLSPVAVFGYTVGWTYNPTTNGVSPYPNSTTTPSVNSIIATSTTATSTFAGAISTPALCFPASTCWYLLPWSDVRLAETANYTLTNGDKGKTIALGGNALFTLTVNAASGYDSNFSVQVVNEDVWGTGRGKIIAINGIQNFILWPGTAGAANDDPEAGNVMTLFAQNNVWHIIKSSRARLGKGTVNVYTDYVNGSDVVGATDCLATGTSACQSVTHVLNSLVNDQFDWNGTESGQTQLTINMAANTTDSKRIHWSPHGTVGAQGGAAITIDGGNTATLGGDVGGETIQLYYGAALTIQNVIVGSAAGQGCSNIQDNAYLGIASTTWNCNGNGISANRGGSIFFAVPNVTVSFGNVGAANFVLSAANGGHINADDSSVTFQLIGNLVGSAFVAAQRGGSVRFNNNTFNLNGYTFTGNQVNVSENGDVHAQGATIPGTGANESRGGIFDADAAPVVAAGYTGATSFTANGVLYGQGSGPILVTNSANSSILSTNASGVPSFSGFGSTTAFSTSGTFYPPSGIWNSSNVGIASTTPSTNLGVVGNGYFTGGLGVGLLNTSAGTLQTSGLITGGTTLALNGTTGTTTIASGQGFTIGNSQFVVQQGSGVVSIGSTTPPTNSNLYLEYNKNLNQGNGAGLTVRNFTNNGNADASISVQNAGALNSYMAVTSASFAGAGGANASQFGSGNNIAVEFMSNNLEVARFSNSTNNFNFGVGTSTPWGQISASSTSATSPALAVEQKSSGPVAIFSGGNVGIGTTTPWAALSLVSNNNPVFVIATTTGTVLDEIDNNGHEITGGNVPTINTCVGCSVIGDDSTMVLTTGTTISTASINFANTWKNASGQTRTPMCVASEESAGSVAVGASSTPTVLTLTFASALTSKQVSVFCRISQNFTF